MFKYLQNRELGIKTRPNFASTNLNVNYVALKQSNILQAEYIVRYEKNGPIIDQINLIDKINFKLNTQSGIVHLVTQIPINDLLKLSRHNEHFFHLTCKIMHRNKKVYENNIDISRDADGTNLHMYYDQIYLSNDKIILDLPIDQIMK